MLLSSLSETKLVLLTFRSQTKLLTENISSKHICLHHHAYYLKKFSSHVSSKCCNLFGNHNQKSRKGCREITLELVKVLAPTFPTLSQAKRCAFRAGLQQNPNQLKLSDRANEVLVLQVTGNQLLAI